MDKAFEVLKALYDKFLKKNGNLILILGLLGLGLILLSEFWPGQKTDEVQPKEQSQTVFSEQEYIDMLEERLTDLLSKTDGVGKVQVLITAETGLEYIYATESRSNENVSTSADSMNQRTSDNEDTIIIIRAQDGSESPVLVKSLPPVLRGVAVVCEGADSPIVRQRVLDTVTTLLDISSSKVCITKKS